MKGTIVSMLMLASANVATATSQPPFAFVGNTNTLSSNVKSKTSTPTIMHRRAKIIPQQHPLILSPSLLSSSSPTFLYEKNAMVLKMSDSDGEESSSPEQKRAATTGRGKRRRRKDGLDRAPPSSASTSPSESKEEEEEEEEETTKKEEEDVGKAPETVEMQVMDVRDILSGKTPSSVAAATPATESSSAQEQQVEDDEDEWEEVDEDEEEDDDEYEYVYVDEDDDDDDDEEEELETSSSMAKLKAAAKRMREAEALSKAETKAAASTNNNNNNYEEESTGIQIPDAVGNALSTIVTVDFFVVLGLLAWFLAGIFCSYILKDDTVQIAFNSNFQMIVQPALGILMIGSAASAVIGKEEE